MAEQLANSCAGPRSLRQRSSIHLDLHEDHWKRKAELTYQGKLPRESQDDNPFHVADREHWPKFQNLLDEVITYWRQTDGENETVSQAEIESELEQAVAAYKDVSEKLYDAIMRHAAEPKAEAFIEDTFVSPALKGCVFVGHVATDLDSVAGAMGAAALFGGIACRAEQELNGEIKYALEQAEMEQPPLFDECPGAGIPDADGKFLPVCLVDHNEIKQMVPALRNDPDRKKRIVGLIDHHALAESFTTDNPILMDVRPWGSMSSIVAHMYIRNNRLIDRGIARLLMCAILSDTLNLQSATTTNADRFAVAVLSKMGDIADPDETARFMFRAKTKWIVNLGPYAMVRGDQKDFTVDGWKFGIAVLEVTDTEPVLACADKLILELRALKIEKGNGEVANQLDFAFLFIVNTVKLSSVLLVCGGREYALAQEAFANCPFAEAKAGMPAPGKTIGSDKTLCDVGPLVSRKMQFVPAFSRILSKGFTCHKERVSSPDYVDGDDDKALAEVLRTGGAKVTVTEDQQYEREYGRASVVILGA